MLLENEHIKLRALEIQDIEFLYKIENDSECWTDGNNIQPYSIHTLQRYINAQTNDLYTNHQLRLVITLKSENKAIGMIDLYDFDPMHQHAWIGIIIEKTFRNQGFGIASLSLMSHYVFDFLHLHQLISQVAIDNEASNHLFNSAGYTRCGILKEFYVRPWGYIDAVNYQLISHKKA